MKSKKIILCSISCILLVNFLFCGCGSINLKANFPKIILEEWESSINEDQPEFLDLLDERSSFKCIRLDSVADGYYVVTAKVSSPDINESLKEYQNQVYSQEINEEEMNKKLCELINSAELKTTEQTVDVIVDEDGNVRVQFNDDFVNAMFGYAYTDSMKVFIEEQGQEE